MGWQLTSSGEVHLFATEEKKEIYPDQLAPPCRAAGHGGADLFLMSALKKAIAHDEPALLYSNVVQSLISQKVVFAAERSRLDKTIIQTVY